MSEKRDFCSGNKLQKIYKSNKYGMLNPHISQSKALSKMYSWSHMLKKHFFSKAKTGYKRIADDPVEDVPKGHLPVYVGEKDDDTCRYMVPVIYFNHPLFGNLLSEAEKEFGYDHPGGIQIPCRVSEFEIVRRKIDSCSMRA